MLSWIATIANNGVVHKPFIVDRIEDNDGVVKKRFEPEQIGAITIDGRYLQAVREGMREAALTGTAKSLSTLSIEVAGKTGTAQFDARDLNRAHAWFVGYAPYDSPEIAIVVLIEDGGTGANNAVPIAKAGFRYWAERGE